MATTTRKRTTSGRKPAKKPASKVTASASTKPKSRTTGRKTAAKSTTVKKTVRKKTGKSASSSAGAGSKKPALKKPKKKVKAKVKTKPNILSNRYPMEDPHGVIRSEEDLVAGVHFYRDMDGLLDGSSFDYVDCHLNRGPKPIDAIPEESLIRTACKLIEHGKSPDGALVMLGVDIGLARKWFMEGAENPDSVCGGMVRAFIAASEWREYRMLGLLSSGIKFGIDVRWLLSKWHPERWGEPISKTPDKDLLPEDLRKKFLQQVKEEVQNKMSVDDAATMLCLLEQIAQEGGNIGLPKDLTVIPKGPVN